MVITLLIVLHVVICLALVFIVLIQTGKGGLDSNFGGMATNVLGTQGANEFVKLWTKILFGAFVVSCVFLAFYVKQGGESNVAPARSRLQDEAQREMQNIPVQSSDVINIDDFQPIERRKTPVQTETPE